MHQYTYPCTNIHIHDYYCSIFSCMLLWKKLQRWSKWPFWWCAALIAQGMQLYICSVRPRVESHKLLQMIQIHHFTLSRTQPLPCTVVMKATFDIYSGFLMSYNKVFTHPLSSQLFSGPNCNIMGNLLMRHLRCNSSLSRYEYYNGQISLFDNMRLWWLKVGNFINFF